MDLVINHHLR